MLCTFLWEPVLKVPELKVAESLFSATPASGIKLSDLVAPLTLGGILGLQPGFDIHCPAGLHRLKTSGANVHPAKYTLCQNSGGEKG